MVFRWIFADQHHFARYKGHTRYCFTAFAGHWSLSGQQFAIDWIHQEAIHWSLHQKGFVHWLLFVCLVLRVLSMEFHSFVLLFFCSRRPILRFIGGYSNWRRQFGLHHSRGHLPFGGHQRHLHKARHWGKTIVVR